MGCPVQHDLNVHLTLLAKQDALAEQVESELIDEEHLDDFIDGMPGDVFKEYAAFILREIVSTNRYVGDKSEAYAASFKAQVAEKINSRVY